MTDAALRKRINTLCDVRELLDEQQEDLLLQARALVLCNLPYKRSAKQSIMRSAPLGSGSRLRVTFTCADPKIGLPFGADRALFGWIQTRAFRDGCIFFDSLHDYLGAFGLSSTSGTSYQRFHQRLERLQNFSLKVQIETQEDVLGVLAAYPISQSYHPKSPRAARQALAEASPAQGQLIPARYGMRLSDQFWEYLKGNPVPLPLDLMRLFHDKPMAWDFAQFLLYRSFAAKRPSAIPWSTFCEQFGVRDSNLRRLRQKIKGFLQEIQVVYPDCPAVVDTEGLQVAPWRPGALALS